MPTAKQATAIKSLSEKINNAFEQGIDEFNLRRLKVEATRVKKQDPANGFDLLGQIACLENNIDELHSNHTTAIKYSPYEAIYYYNYGSSLFHSLFFYEAIEFLTKAHEMAMENIVYLNRLISAIVAIGDKKTFLTYNKQHAALTGKDHFAMKNVVFQQHPHIQFGKYLTNNKDLSPKIEKIITCVGRYFKRPIFVLAEYDIDPEYGNEFIAINARIRWDGTQAQIDGVLERQDKIDEYMIDEDLIDDRICFDVSFV